MAFAKGPQPGDRPKARVLKRRPNAKCRQFSFNGSTRVDGYVVESGLERLGTGTTAADAWRAAEDYLERHYGAPR